ncbi:MAG: alpha/beta fold hydrolase [Pseudomonadales bacterium]
MPSRQRITFSNDSGEQLAAALEVPDRAPKAYALFAHCFTCGKDVAAAGRIARSLAAMGIAVLRFDFTGLGGSAGDFANTNFSSNVADLLAAAAFLRSEYRAPQLLIGHSLGGTAVLAAAGDIPEAEAVVTIGAPASADHVIAQFADDVPEIEREGDALVSLAGREFRVQRQFLDDVRGQTLERRVAALRKSLLVMHAPLDTVVDIEQASSIFSAARHPKSFVSLNGADHLVSKLEDAQYVASTIVAWAQRYVSVADSTPAPDVAGGEMFVGEGNHKFLRDVRSDDHAWVADEPKRMGGGNLGPDPYEHLLAALGTCTSMTIRMYANRKGWPLEDVQIQLNHSREHAADCDDCETGTARMEVLSRTIHLEGDLDAAQRARLLEIADRCPVHRTLESDLRIVTNLSARA